MSFKLLNRILNIFFINTSRSGTARCGLPRGDALRAGGETLSGQRYDAAGEDGGWFHVPVAGDLRVCEGEGADWASRSDRLAVRQFPVSRLMLAFGVSAPAVKHAVFPSARLCPRGVFQ